MTDGRVASWLARSLARKDLSAAFERWRVALEPGEERATDAAEWAGALVLVEGGTLEVECRVGGCRRFVAGDLIALGWLPLSSLRNRGAEPVRLVAVRRRGPLPSDAFLHVIRSEPNERRPPTRDR